jgi:Txe/YoeB family toxin of Txe-Axe toxin-antitoxin module/predicted RNA-binding Zn-ribbon protein involved in translation (DUF1610 family)
MTKFDNDFQEIRHSGGKVTVVEYINEQGQKLFGLRYTHSTPFPQSLIGIYITMKGEIIAPVTAMEMMQPLKKPYPPGMILMISSDSHGWFGHKCPICGKYWRSSDTSLIWPMTCPYCGFQNPCHAFLTEGQARYVITLFNMIIDTHNQEDSRLKEIDMDDAIDIAAKNGKKPNFYYTETSQQKQYQCSACNTYNDILGRYGYCSNCGTHNGYDELSEDLKTILETLEKNSLGENIRKIGSSLDSFTRTLAKQIDRRIKGVAPKIVRALFHGIKKFELLESIKIYPFKGIDANEKLFLNFMFSRRHVHEHTGGIVDEVYLKDTNDNTVVLGQSLRENPDDVRAFAELAKRIAFNIRDDFHKLFPPIEKPIKWNNDRKEHQKKYTSN